jgi:hypothetical protein
MQSRLWVSVKDFHWQAARFSGVSAWLVWPVVFEPQCGLAVSPIHLEGVQNPAQ